MIDDELLEADPLRGTRQIQPGIARPGELVLDCVVVEEDLWWAGYHRAATVMSRYPGGMLDLTLPEDAVSRAWLKMEEALRWSRLPLTAGDRVAEIGFSDARVVSAF